MKAILAQGRLPGDSHRVRWGQDDKLSTAFFKPVETPVVAGGAPVVAGHTPVVAGNAPAVAGNAPAVAGHTPAVAGHTPVVAGQASSS